MTQRVQVSPGEGVITLTLDDGKVNALSAAMFDELGTALDRAQADGGVVVMRGRPGVFCAGFDLGTLRAGGAAAGRLLEAGARLTERLLSFPAPVVAVLTGPAMAMGAFVALSTDWRIAVDDPAFKVAANEVAIGLTLPRFACAVMRHRLVPSQFDVAAVTARPYGAARALAAGWVDDLVPAAQLESAVADAVRLLRAIDRQAHVATKLRVRADTLRQLRAAIDDDVADWRSRIWRS